jgi:hypothetical protein
VGIILINGWSQEEDVIKSFLLSKRSCSQETFYTYIKLEHGIFTIHKKNVHPLIFLCELQ